MERKPVYVHTLDADEETLEQFYRCTREPFVTAAALMPDAHHGYVAPIGSVLMTDKYLVPAWVGYDIGCGIIACRFSGEHLVDSVREHAEGIYAMIRERIPMGTGKVNHVQNISAETKQAFKGILEEFRKGPYQDAIGRYLKNKALSHLGSLGSGNHFMELAFHDDELWLVIHSGSRGVGHKVAQHYMQQASGSNREFECTAPLHVDEPEGREYANVLQFGQDFALLNRLEMAKTVTKVLREVLGQDELDYELWVNQHHNHAIKTEDGYIHRKGATPASKGERGVIPANMRDGTILVEGLGDANFLYSSSHGAGRCLSRTRAKTSLDLATFQKQMSGVVGTVNDRTLDEAPDAYKPIDSVMKAQQTSVRELKRLKPLINWKGD